MKRNKKLDILSQNMETPLPKYISTIREENQIRHSNKNLPMNRPTRKKCQSMMNANEHEIYKHKILNWLKLNPRDLEMYEFMVTLERDREEWVEVDYWISELRKYDSNNPIIGEIEEYYVYKNEIGIYQKNNQWQKVIQICHKILSANNNDKFALTSMARSYKHLGSTSKEKQTWQKLFNLGGLDNLKTLEYCNVLYVERDFITLTRLLGARLKYLDESLLEIYVRSLFNMRKFSECILKCQSLLIINKSNKIGMRLLSRSLIRTGQIGQAVDILESRVSNKDENVELFEDLIECYLRMDKIKKVDKMWEIISKKSENDFDSFLVAVEISLKFNWNSKYKRLLENKRLKSVWKGDNIKISKIALKYGLISESWKYLKISQRNDDSDNVMREINEILSITRTHSREIESSIRGPKFNYVTSLVVREILRKSDKIKNKIRKKVKICIVTSSLNRGGAERQVSFTTKGLVERGFDANLVIHRNNEGKKGTYLDYLKSIRQRIDILSERAQKDIINDNKETIGEYLDLLNLLNNTTYNKTIELIDYFSKNSPDLIHAWQDETILTSAIAAAITNSPILIGSARSMRPDRKSELHIRKKPYLMECYNLILKEDWFHFTINSNAGRKSYAEWLDMNESEMRVIHNGTDFKNMEENIRIGAIKSEIRELGLTKYDIIIGGIFRLEGGKRPELWIRILEDLINKDNRIKGILIGGGKMEETVKKWINEKGLEKSIKILGEKSDVAGWLINMDLFLFTSLSEGLPNVIIEAQGFGVPVISTNVGGVSEIVIDGVTGKLVEGEDSGKISKFILKSLKNGDLITMGEKSKYITRVNFSIEKMLDQTEELYNNVISTIN